MPPYRSIGFARFPQPRDSGAVDCQHDQKDHYLKSDALAGDEARLGRPHQERRDISCASVGRWDQVPAGPYATDGRVDGYRSKRHPFLTRA